MGFEFASDSLDKIFWFTTIFTGFWVFMIAIAGWMLKSPFINWLNNKIEHQIENKIEEDGIKKLLQDTKEQIVEEATNEMSETLNEYEKKLEDYAEQIRKLEEFRNIDYEKMTKQQKEEFERIVEELRGKKDKSAQEWFYIGREEQNKKQYKKAIKAYDKAILGGMNDTAVYNNCAIACVRDNQIDKAEENYKKSISLRPIDFLAYANLLELYLIKNNKLEDSFVDLFKEKFSSNEKQYFKYQMLDILQEVKNGEFSKEKILSWTKQNSDYSLSTWSFGDLEDWIEKEENPTIKENLLYALSIFKAHKND